MSDRVSAPDGVEIRYEAAGSGTPALVFVHGWSCDRSYWKGQLPAQAGQHRVVAVDLAGHGESDDGRAAHTMASFGADVAAVMDRLELDDAVLIGHSMGGDVILETALLRPDRVSGLVWVDTYSTLGTPRTAEEVRAFADSFHPDFVERTQRLVRAFSCRPLTRTWSTGSRTTCRRRRRGWPWTRSSTRSATTAASWRCCRSCGRR